MSEASSPNGDVLVRAVGVRKSYRLGDRVVEVLRGVDLEVARGELVALTGASGSGKSTLLHLLVGLDAPNAGEIRFSGHNLAKLSSVELARFRNLKVGFVFQAYHILPELDALENVCLPARIARLDSKAAASRGRELLDRVGLGDRTDHKPYELSGGEQQRVAIARSLINNPELLLADEPTGNLDSHTGQEIIELLCALRAERQTTLIIATHDSRIASQAPRVVGLLDGQIR
ncbi:MAG: ABC transporter ATP-binding protein [Verrucomicrobia bacterium]|nr:ABC transporter ATP-binding protein [Verrucomicrobiota bacterium]